MRAAPGPTSCHSPEEPDFLLRWPETPWRMTVSAASHPYWQQLHRMQQRLLPVGVPEDPHDLSFLAVGYDGVTRAYSDATLVRNQLPVTLCGFFQQIYTAFVQYDSERQTKFRPGHSLTREMVFHFLTFTVEGTLLQGPILACARLSGVQEWPGFATVYSRDLSWVQVSRGEAGTRCHRQVGASGAVARSF